MPIVLHTVNPQNAQQFGTLNKILEAEKQHESVHMKKYMKATKICNGFRFRYIRPYSIS